MGGFNQELNLFFVIHFLTKNVGSHFSDFLDLQKIMVEGILAENIILRKWLSMNVYQLQHIGRNTFIKNNFWEIS